MAEIFGMVMVNTGIDPEYFLDRMSWTELTPILNRIDEDYKDRWEQTRAVIFRIALSFSASEEPITAHDVYPLPWDPKPEKAVIKPDMDPERIARMEEMVNRVVSRK